jgi:hypothetical protein
MGTSLANQKAGPSRQLWDNSFCLQIINYSKLRHRICSGDAQGELYGRKASFCFRCTVAGIR